jgi:hypothetical protein
LSDCDKASQLPFCNKFQGLLLQNPDVIHQLMSVVANFHLCGAVNKQNFRYWSETNLQQMHETPFHSPEVVAWCGISSFMICGPYFVEVETSTFVTINAEHYGAMLGHFLAPQLPAQ